MALGAGPSLTLSDNSCAERSFMMTGLRTAREKRGRRYLANFVAGSILDPC